MDLTTLIGRGFIAFLSAIEVQELPRRRSCLFCAKKEFDVPTLANEWVPHCTSDAPNNYHRPEHNHNERGKADYPIV